MRHITPAEVFFDICARADLNPVTVGEIRLTPTEVQFTLADPRTGLLDMPQVTP